MNKKKKKKKISPCISNIYIFCSYQMQTFFEVLHFTQLVKDTLICFQIFMYLDTHQNIDHHA
jgi:hypothetical protein